MSSRDSVAPAAEFRRTRGPKDEVVIHLTRPQRNAHP
jgi:hypothetical protein